MANKTSSFLDNSPPKVDQIWLNMVTGEVANAIPMAGDSVDSTGLVNNQLTNAVKSYVSQAGILCTDTSSGANVYILNASTPFTNPVLKTGTRVRFKTANANTGSSTITAFGGSGINCKKSDGSTDLASGDILANTEVEFVYNGTNWVQGMIGNSNLTNFSNLTPAANKALIINGSGAMAFQDRLATTTNQGVQYLKSNKNAIINGDFNIWQRGTSFTSVGAGVYTSDRWQYGKNGAMVHDITLSSDVPTVAQAGRLIKNSLKIDCQAVDASIASSEYAMLSQNIEGYNFVPLAQKTMTLSFWVKATKTGIYSVSFRNGGPDRSYVAEYTVNVSNTWEFKTLTILPSPASGSWDYTNSRGLSVDFTLAVGSTFQTTKDAWQTGNFLGTSNQVNACDSTSNDFLITSVQLEEGNVATPFENRAFADELRLCQRYYEKTYNQSAVAGALTFIGSRAFSSQNGQQNLCPVYFKVTKRANPTITLFSPITGVAGKISTGVIDIDGTAYNSAEDGFYVGPTTTTALTNLFFQYSAISEL